MHRLKDGEAKILGYLEDYAFFVQGLIDLYEAGFALHYLTEADRLTRQAIDLFWDQEGGGFFMTAGDDPSVLVRSKSDHDGAEPSGNSVMAMNLLRDAKALVRIDLSATMLWNHTSIAQLSQFVAELLAPTQQAAAEPEEEPEQANDSDEFSLDDLFDSIESSVESANAGSEGTI